MPVNDGGNLEKFALFQEQKRSNREMILHLGKETLRNIDHGRIFANTAR
jgi:hypothetical protein